MTATPPSHPPSMLLMAGAVTTLLPGKLFSHRAAADACQCVSWRATMSPLRSRLMMVCFLSAACAVLWLSSQRGFQDVKTVADCILARRDCSRSVPSVQLLRRCCQLVTGG
eukprot:14891471-Heterocapsa_arctica.AAC.1